MSEAADMADWQALIASGVVAVRERRTVVDPLPVMLDGERTVGLWTVLIGEHPTWFERFGVWSEHFPTGAWTSVRRVGSLGAARRKAGELATVLSGSGCALDWRSL